MNRLYRSELRRAFRSIGMKVALVLGCVLAIWNVIKIIIPLHNMLYSLSSEFKQDPLFIPEGLFNNWMGVTLYPIQSYIFFMIIPLLATLPFGSSYYEDQKSGYIKSVCTRIDRLSYLKAKYFAVFISGGCTVAIPLILNLVLSAMYLPMIKPDSACNTSIFSTSMFYQLFYSHPLLYNLMFIFIDFVFGGIIATIALSYTYYTEYRFSVLIAPFVLYFFLYSLTNLLDKTQYSPFYLLNAGASGNHFYYYIIMFVTFFLLSYVLFIKKGKNRDIL